MQPKLQLSSQFRWLQLKRNSSIFYHKDAIFHKTQKKQRIPSDPEKIGFGKYFTSFMINIDWNKKNGWFPPEFQPFQNFQIHPAAKALHYGIELFEGMKAYHGVDGKFRLFRPEKNIERMRRSARRLCLPDFDVNQTLLLLDEFIRLESEIIPQSKEAALYLRPMLFATEGQIRVAETTQAKWACFGTLAGDYFNYEKGLTLLADPEYVRSWPGGVGQYKIGGNYAPTIWVAQRAASKDCDQVLWLSGKEKFVTEAGAMNIFVLWTNEQNELELITAPVESGLLLPGVTRESVIDLVQEWNDIQVTIKDFTMDQLTRAIKENRVHECFVSGTAALVGPVSNILYEDSKNQISEKLVIPTLKSKHGLWKKLASTITSIQYGEIEKKEWQRVVEI